MLQYTLEARIEDDSSNGVNEVRIFCFDLLLLVCNQSKQRFTIHDSRLFANMNLAEKHCFVLFMICVGKIIFNICSIKEDAILSFQTLMSDEEYRQIIEGNIILEINDASSESKLLGTQIDIDLEDKSKAPDDIQ